MTSRPTIVVLATGQAAGPRADAALPLAQPFGGGTVLGCTVRHAIETGWPVVVVTTEALAGRVARWVATRDIVVLGEGDLARGPGHAIVTAAAATADADGWLLMPGELPLVRPSSMLAVGQALQEHPVTYAQHLGRQGHPVGVAAELFSELLTLAGDDGPRRLIARYPAFGVELDDPGVLGTADPVPPPAVVGVAGRAA